MRQELGVADLDRAGLEVFGELVVVMRGSAQHVARFPIGDAVRQAPRPLGLIAVIRGKVHTGETPEIDNAMQNSSVGLTYVD